MTWKTSGSIFKAGDTIAMKRTNTVFRLLALVVSVFALTWAEADSWDPPETEVSLSANGLFRVTVIPRPLSGPLEYFEEKLEGAEPAGQAKGEVQVSALARVEQLEAQDTWRLVWEMPLVNDVAPTSVLLTDDGAFLVTFDNWHSVGFGDDVVVIYDRYGKLVRKLSLEQILPAAYVEHIPQSISSRWWGNKHALVDDDRIVELQIVPPGDRVARASLHVPVRIRLADGEVLPPGGEAWDRAMDQVSALESNRLTAWEELRRLRASPLTAPVSRDTKEWRSYMFELRDRIEGEGESFGGMLLAAPGEERGYHDADAIAAWVEHYSDEERRLWRSLIIASPTSDRLAAVVVTPLLARAEGSMKTAHLVFVGTPAEGEQVTEAATRSGMKITVVDRTAAFPPGEPLPPTPPPQWKPWGR
jgi:hypothetical protein